MGNVFVMAGIPRVMQGMFDAVKHDLQGGRPMLARTVSCHLPEGIIAKGLGEIQARHPDLDLGSYPFYRRGEFGTSLVIRGRDPARVDAAKDEVIALVKGLGGDPVEEWGDGPMILPAMRAEELWHPSLSCLLQIDGGR